MFINNAVIVQRAQLKNKRKKYSAGFEKYTPFSNSLE